jgi:hypothetical protein
MKNSWRRSKTEEEEKERPRKRRGAVTESGSSIAKEDPGSLKLLV